MSSLKSNTDSAHPSSLDTHSSTEGHVLLSTKRAKLDDFSQLLQGIESSGVHPSLETFAASTDIITEALNPKDHHISNENVNTSIISGSQTSSNSFIDAHLFPTVTVNAATNLIVERTFKSVHQVIEAFAAEGYEVIRNGGSKRTEDALKHFPDVPHDAEGDWEFKYRRLMCAKYRAPILKQSRRKNSQGCGCTWKAYVSYREQERNWVVTSITNSHNHPPGAIKAPSGERVVFYESLMQKFGDYADIMSRSEEKYNRAVKIAGELYEQARAEEPVATESSSSSANDDVLETAVSFSAANNSSSSSSGAQV